MKLKFDLLTSHNMTQYQKHQSNISTHCKKKTNFWKFPNSITSHNMTLYHSNILKSNCFMSVIVLLVLEIYYCELFFQEIKLIHVTSSSDCRYMELLGASPLPKKTKNKF